MYIPKYFREERRDVLLATIRAIQFGVLVVRSSEDLEGAHIPFIVREGEDGVTLEAHVARPNALWRSAQGGCRAVAIFQGPQAYIHPGWFETKRETGKGVPTWNYIALHCHGELVAIEDTDWLLSHVRALSDINESGRDQPWSVDDAPDGYIEGLVRAIVAFGCAWIASTAPGSSSSIIRKRTGGTCARAWRLRPILPIAP